jgi:hypothetical protein
MPVSTKVQVRRDTAANWTTANPTLASGEIGFETDTLEFKIGNGSTAWTSLKYSTDVSLLNGTMTSATFAGLISDETGTGNLVFSTSPTFTTPNIGVATGTSLNVTGNLRATGQIFSNTAGQGSITLGDAAITKQSGSAFQFLSGGSFTQVVTAPTFTSNVATGTSPFTVTSTTQVANLNAATTSISVNIGAGDAGSLPYQSAANTTTFLARTATNNSTLAFNSSTNAPFWVQPTLSNTYYAATTSAQLAGTISDETGSGNLVFSTSPTLTTPLIANSTTTAASGLLDYNGDIYTLTTTGTSAGKGTIFAPAWAYSNANATAATTNTPQSIFPTGARTLTLEAGKTYFFKLNLSVNLSFSSGPAAIQLVPTFANAPVSIYYNSMFISGTSGGVLSSRVLTTTATSVSPTLSSTTSNSTIFVEGYFRSNATTGGTVEFKYQISTGGGSTATMLANSYQQITKIGSTAPAIISGGWA